MSPTRIRLKFHVWVKVFLAGMAAALFSPNRTGEWIGRILSLPSQLRWPLGTSALLSSLAQLCITLLGGLLAWEFWVPDSVFPIYLTPFRWPIRLLGLGLFLFFLFRLPVALKQFHRWAPKSLKPKMKLAGHDIALKNWGIGLGWALARYLVFLLQWWIGLQVLGVDFPFLTVVPAVAFIFFGNALLPSFAFTELASRGSLSVLFLGKLGIAPGLALLVASLLWLINVALPALPGFYFLIKKPVQE